MGGWVGGWEAEHRSNSCQRVFQSSTELPPLCPLLRLLCMPLYGTHPLHTLPPVICDGERSSSAAIKQEKTIKSHLNRRSYISKQDEESLCHWLFFLESSRWHFVSALRVIERLTSALSVSPSPSTSHCKHPGPQLQRLEPRNNST